MKKFTTAVLLLLIAVIAVAQDAPVPSVPAKPPVVFGLTSPMVYDGDGKVVGQLLTIDDANASAIILAELSDPADAVVPLRIRRGKDGKVKWGSSTFIFFTESGCKGAAYTGAGSSFSDYVAAVDDDGTLLLGDLDIPAGAPSDQITTNSIRMPDGTCDERRLFQGASQVVKLERKLKLTDVYPAPLRVSNLTRIRSVTPAP